MPSTAATRFQELKKTVADAKKEMKKTAKTVFTEASVELFEKNPNLVSFGWTQYTPYFNDGDACIFSANTDYPTCTLKMSDGKALKYDENYGEYRDDEDNEFDPTEEVVNEYEKESAKIKTQIGKFLKQFDEDDLEVMFGDHAEVTVSPKGKTHVEQCEHD